MNKEQIKGNWKTISGKIKQEWGKLTDDDLKIIEGKTEELAGIVERRYGYDKEEAKKRVNKFIDTL